MAIKQIIAFVIGLEVIFHLKKFKDGYIWEFSQGYSSGYKIHVNAWYKDYCLGNIYFYFPNFCD